MGSNLLRWPPTPMASNLLENYLVEACLQPFPTAHYTLPPTPAPYRTARGEVFLLMGVRLYIVK